MLKYLSPCTFCLLLFSEDGIQRKKQLLWIGTFVYTGSSKRREWSLNKIKIIELARGEFRIMENLCIFFHALIKVSRRQSRLLLSFVVLNRSFILLLYLGGGEKGKLLKKLIFIPFILKYDHCNLSLVPKSWLPFFWLIYEGPRFRTCAIDYYWFKEPLDKNFFKFLLYNSLLKL